MHMQRAMNMCKLDKNLELMNTFISPISIEKSFGVENMIEVLRLSKMIPAANKC